MLFNFPTFLNTKEQTPSERLYNNLKILVQTHIAEVWYNIQFGTNIRDSIKAGIDDIVVSDIRDELQEKIVKYFNDKLTITKMDIQQKVDKLYVYLTYMELRTGVHRTMQVVESIENKDMSFYYDYKLDDSY